MKAITALFIIFILTSCETRDFLESLNEAPKINFTNNPDQLVLSDSIKLSLKNSQEKYTISLRITDRNENIVEVLYSQLAGTGKLKQNSIDIIDNNIVFENSSELVFDYYPETLGIHKIGIQVKDNFGLSSSVTIQITAFDNLPPVALQRWTKRGVFGRYHYEIRATESFDKDSRFGGKIEEYEYKAQGVIRRLLATTQDADKFQVIFDEKGIYPFEVRVRDNDGRWSELVKDDIIVN
jgi:hypothetical protein